MNWSLLPLSMDTYVCVNYLFVFVVQIRAERVMMVAELWSNSSVTSVFGGTPKRLLWLWCEVFSSAYAFLVGCSLRLTVQGLSSYRTWAAHALTGTDTCAC